MSILQLFLCFLLLIVVYIFGKSKRKLRLPPGPWQLPIFGYLPFIDAKNPHLTLTTLARKYGPIYGIQMGSVYAVILSDHRLIRQVLAKEEFAGRAPLYLTHGIMKGYGLICAEGESWREQRKFVTACLKDLGSVKYSCTKRDKLEERILIAVNETVSKLKDRGYKEDGVDPFHTLHHCLGNLINDLVFGVTYEENDETWKMLQELQDEGLKYIGVAGPLNFLPFLRHLPGYKNIIKFVMDGQETTHKVYRKLIEDHQKQPTNADDHFLAAFDAEVKKRMSTGEIRSFADPQICYLLADMYGAGIDTTLTTLRWFLLFMAVYPNEQEEIQKEIDAILCDREPTLDDRSALPRLEAAIAETQRIRSIVPLGFPHGSMKNTVIDGYDIPKGSMIVPLQWAIHMDSRFWPEPDKFKPERFLTDAGCLTKPDAFLPFQSGKRMCVGDELAKMIIFLFTARILQTFVLSIPSGTSPNIEGDCGITLTPKPHNLIFKFRS